MLAFEPYHHHHYDEERFGRSLGLDHGIQDPSLNLSMNLDGLYDPSHGFNPFSYSIYENTPLLVEAPQDTFAKYEMYRTASLGAHLNPSSQHSSTLSSASVHSIPSASSSTVGSPYSGHAQIFTHPDSWTTAHDGLCLGAAIVNHDAYLQSFAAPELESDLSFGVHPKLSEDFVGKRATISSVCKQSSESFPVNGSRPQTPPPSSPLLSASREFVTIDSVLSRAKASSGSGGSCHSKSVSSPSSATPGEKDTPRSTKSKSAFKSPHTPASAIATTSRFASPQPINHSATAVTSAANPANTCRPVPAEYPVPSIPNSPLRIGQFQSHFFAQSSGNFVPPLESSYPSLIQGPRTSFDTSTTYPEHSMFPTLPPTYPSMSPAQSPAPSFHEPVYPSFPSAHGSPRGSPAIAYNSLNFSPPQPQAQYMERRSSMSSFHSKHSHESPLSVSSDFDEDGKQKGRCPNPDCGRVFKDLKAHMLTHQPERPEKCPILNCEYNQKGFARKYDKNRHTLTHYKGTMVCGFCPGSGSAAEKSFNRADVFKRHLTSVHGVEQTPPNSRKRSPHGSTKKLSHYCQDATGKCSTCSATFSNAQDFYEHLDDCVLRVVQQEEPSEAINAQRLAEVAADPNVKDTMERHMLSSADDATVAGDDELDDEEEDDEEDDEDTSYGNMRSGKGTIKAKQYAPGARAVIGSCIAKPGRPARTGLTYSKGGVPLVGKGRKKRKHYPPSWGMSADKMQMKKRVLCVYEGQRRLWKDDLMMHHELEVRMKLPDGKSYVTDLDVETLKRADAFHHASEEEKGPWVQEDVPVFNLEELMS